MEIPARIEAKIERLPGPQKAEKDTGVYTVFQEKKMSEAIEAVVVRESSTLVALERAQIDQQVATAKAYPRSIQTFKDAALTMATIDQETAESMTYAIPRDGKIVEGPSVRLAEIAGSCWGNVRYGARVVEISDEFLTARGMCYDLERNVAIEIDVRRRIVNKSGKRFGSDMIQTTGQAACAIALRNAIWKVIPMAFIKPIMEQAKRVAAGDVKSLNQRRDAALLWFREKGVKPEQVLGLLGVPGKEDVTLAHIAQMSAIRTSIKDGEATLEDFFKASATANVTPDNLEAFIQPVSVKAEDDPQKRGPEPVVEATLVEEPKPLSVEKALKATSGKKGKEDAHLATETASKDQKDDLDAIFSKE